MWQHWFQISWLFLSKTIRNNLKVVIFTTILVQGSFRILLPIDRTLYHMYHNSCYQKHNFECLHLMLEVRLKLRLLLAFLLRLHRSSTGELRKSSPVSSVILFNNPSQRPSLEVSLEISVPDSRSRKKNSLNEVCWTFSEETERLVGKKDLKGFDFFLLPAFDVTYSWDATPCQQRAKPSCFVFSFFSWSGSENFFKQPNFHKFGFQKLGSSGKNGSWLRQRQLLMLTNSICRYSCWFINTYELPL